MRFYFTLYNLLIGNCIYLYIIYFKNVCGLIILCAIYQLAIVSRFAIVCLQGLNYPGLSMLYSCLLTLVWSKQEIRLQFGILILQFLFLTLHIYLQGINRTMYCLRAICLYVTLKNIINLLNFYNSFNRSFNDVFDKELSILTTSNIPLPMNLYLSQNLFTTQYTN